MAVCVCLPALAATVLLASEPAAAAAAPPPPAAAAPAATVGQVEVTARAPVAGDLQQGVVGYRPTFFTPVRPGTAMDMVVWLPGFVFEDTRDLRGLEGSTGNVLIDGKPPTSKTDTLQSVLRRIPADQVERIDIIVGGAPGIDMRGRPVIANVILKVSATVQRVATIANTSDAKGREFPSLTLTSSEKRGNKVSQVSLDLTRNLYVGANAGDGVWARYGPTGALQYAARSGFLLAGPRLTASGLYQFPLAGGTLKLSGAARYYGAHNREREFLTSAPGGFTWDLEQIYDQAEVGANYERAFGAVTSETQLLERVSRVNQGTDSRLPPTPYFTHVRQYIDETAIRTTLRYKKSATFNLEGFAEYAANIEKSHTTQAVNGVAQAVPGANVKVDEGRGEAGVTTSWKPTPKVGLDTTLKVESSDIAASGDVVLEHRLTYLKPRAVLALSFDKNTQLRLRLEREVGQISFGNFVTAADYSSSPLRVGNAGLRPQRDWVGEAVLQHGLWNGADLTLTARRYWYRDIVDIGVISTAAGLFAQVGNIGDARETDFAAVLTLPMGWSGLKGAVFRASVTSARSSVVDPVTGADRPLSGQPKLRWELHWAQDFAARKLNWGVDAFYAGAYAVPRPFGDQAIGAWLHANVFVEYRAAKRTVLRAEVQNLPGRRVLSSQDTYAGLKTTAALTRHDEWRLTAGPLLYLRLRQTFD
ncbi:MAG TPA: hypothetical protein VL460_12230 [Caulobacteraceae bacterium]|jgi:hypothetical protein|nr:hypothetical protein [Caulobacteraceae bacterium]